MKSPLRLLTFLAMVTCAHAQNTLYSFTNETDGTEWPATLLPDDSWYEQAGFENYTNNTVMFQSNYVACGNAARIEDEAVWGNPQDDGDDPSLDVDFGDFFVEVGSVLTEQVQAVAFDFAWANAAGSPASPPPLGNLGIGVYDYDGGYEYFDIPLGEVFTHGLGGSGEGREGHVVLVPDGVNIFNIASIEIDLSPLVASGNGFQPEFALDNLEISLDGTLGGTANVFPIDYDGSPAGDFGTNCLKNTGVFYGIGFDMKNDGDAATTFTVNWAPSDPALYQPTPQVMVPINPGEIIEQAVLWFANTDTTPSGEYSGTFTIVDDLEPSDPDDIVNLIWFRLYDPPSLSDNSATLIDLSTTNQITVDNAAAGPHAGALRASVKPSQILLDNSRFSLSGITVNDHLDPGQNWTGLVSFNAVGAPAGTNSGQLRMKLQMTTPDNYLNNSTPVSDIVWNLRATVPAQESDTESVTTGQNLGEAGVSISNANTGATFGDGTSGENQDVSLTFNGSPPVGGGGPPVNDAFDVGFSGTVPIYVLQIAFQAGDVPAGYAEKDLRVEVYDTGSSQWVPAISLNSDPTPPAGAEPYLGSYAAFLTELGGGALDAAELSAYGIDTVNNNAWVVLDHASTFRLSVGASSLPPIILSIAYDKVANATTITYQSLPGEVFGVEGGTDLGALGALPDTESGDGTVKHYTDHPAGAPDRYFYRMTRTAP